MRISNFAAALATISATLIGATSASAATTYEATSNVKEGAGAHSLWFSNDGSNPANPDGAVGNRPNHFKFENRSPNYGNFTVDGTTATLTGEVANANGQAFAVELFLVEFDRTGGDPFGLKTIAGQGSAVTDLWTLYDLDTTRASTVSYVSGTGDAALQSFNVALRGGNSDGPFKAQFGIGANDKDKDLLGFSTWITLTDRDTNCSGDCTYNGDFNIVLSNPSNPNTPPVPLPAAGYMLLAGLGGLVAIRRHKRAA